MPKPNPKELLRVAGNYLKAHPEEIWRAAKGVAGQRIGVPMDALRYLVREFATGEKAPKDVVVEAAPPGLRLSLTVSAMGTPLRVSVVRVRIMRVRVRQRFMTMLVNVPRTWRHVCLVGVAVMFVVLVLMGVLEHVMGVEMLVTLG